MNKNQIDATTSSYPYGFGEFDIEDLAILRQYQMDLRLHSREKGREYISELKIRESMKIALECWNEERIGVLPRVA